MARGSILGAALLVAGSCIGGGMLALPVSTAAGGFGPSLVIYVLAWLFMASTGLLLAEVCLATGDRSNMVSMAGRTLGPAGQSFAWLLYLFLFYSLTLAYVTECGNLLTDFVDNRVPEWMGTLIFVAVFSPFIYLGAKYVDKINRVLMAGLALSYVAFVFLAEHLVDVERLQAKDWPLALTALPIIFVSFAYQGIVPTVVHYLGRDGVRIRKAILLGSFIPFVGYVIWQWLIMGSLDQETLVLAAKKNWTAVTPLKQALDDPSVVYTGEVFAFFALVTSFLGVTLGVRDFLADGLHIERTPKGKVLLCILIFVPPLLVSFYQPHIFLTAFQYAGGVGTALLLGLLPILMAWSQRKKVGVQRLLPGGTLVLVLLASFVGLVLYQLV